jgi:hypothetical protein
VGGKSRKGREEEKLQRRKEEAGVEEEKKKKRRHRLRVRNIEKSLYIYIGRNWSKLIETAETSWNGPKFFPERNRP